MVQGKGRFQGTAGEASAFTIQAINRFGYQQSFTQAGAYTRPLFSST